MRIVAGSLGGRVIAAPAEGTTRPTSDRARQALFNILEGGRFNRADGTGILRGALVLDAFAGTGALGLEALSRGAARVTFIDNDRQAADLIRHNLQSLDRDDDGAIVRSDAANPPRASDRHSLAFLDPPYGRDLAVLALAALAARDWLAPGALVVVELGKRDRLDPPEGFTVLDERRYGKARLIFLRYAR
ncbi:MAG: 16S rRNA (guanine(966)-N(2))-methyltransferase RsmD [Alphaproteobacteria bacterium]|nr:16S rRNA (guanine(966)-N(2))-methyltransferase RsmD [Alphaproteobacteria bacterium]